MLVRDLATLARLPNLPSVWSNTFTGYALALVFGQHALADTSVEPLFSITTLGWALVSATLLYLSGTFLNDAVDADFDNRHRPERPIPGRRIKRDSVLYLAMAFGLGGLICAIPLGRHALVVAAAIFVLVLLYTWSHKRTAIAIIPLALCRSLLPVFGAATVIGQWGAEWHNATIWSLSAGGALALYTLGVSLLARGESTDGNKPTTSRCGFALLALPFLIPALLPLGIQLLLSEAPTVHAPLGFFLPGCLGLAWLWFAERGLRSSVAVTVGRTLAGLPLVDAVFLLPVWWFTPPVLAIPFAATVLAMLLRRQFTAT